MTDAPLFPLRAARLTACCALATLPFWFAACTSTKIEGVPDKLPEIALSGSTATPAHHMASYEYPFDSNGNYVSDWAAEGERRAGRSRSATNDDEKKWSGSHGGRTTGSSSAKKSKSTGVKKYVVKQNDTIERIARRHGISVSKLKAANGLKSNSVRIGQTLKIPG